MRVPRHWSRKVETVLHPEGWEVRIVAWGMSESSPEEAQRAAEERFRFVSNSVTRDVPIPGAIYGSYERSQMREVLLEEVRHGSETVGFLTRSRYGAVILNTDRLMFADVDGTGAGCLNFGGAERHRRRQEQALRDRLTKDGTLAGGGYRLYRTPAGFRVLFTSECPPPGSERSKQLLAACKSDPLFQRLCGAQQCYRARLTAKPWRCGVARTPVGFPFEPAEWDRYRAWAAEYDAKAAQYAACQFIGEIGVASYGGAVGDLVRLHDRLSGALEQRPLA